MIACASNTSTDVLAALRVWYADANALVRQRVEEAIFRQRAPLLGQIVRQGIREDIFNTASAGHAGEVVMALLQAMAEAEARLLLLWNAVAPKR